MGGNRLGLIGRVAFKRPLLSSAAMSVMLSAAAAPAFAQDSPPSAAAQPADDRRDVVVVTATRRETSVLDVPYNISVVGSEALQEAAVGDFSDLTKLVPGVAYIDTGNRNAGNTSSFILRGVNADPSSAGADFPTARAPTVSTYLNETPLFFEMNLKDIERVEVLRGPQGTLYGSGAVGGTVKIITKKPELGAYGLEAGAETYSTKGGEWSYGVNGVANVPLGDTLALRASANYDDVGGFIDLPILRALDANGAALPADPANPITSDPLLAPKKNANDSTSLSVRGALLFEPSDTFTATLSHHYQKDEGSGRQAIHPTLGDDDDLFSVIEEPFERTVNVTSLEGQVDFGFATLTSATSYYDIDTDVVGDYSNQIDGRALYYYYNTYPRLTGREADHFEDEVFTQEFRLASPGGDFIDWIGGVYYQQLQHKTQATFSLPGVAAFNALPGQTSATQLFNLYTGDPLDVDLVYAQDMRWENEEIAAFGELTFNLSDRWQITGGARAFTNKFDVVSSTDYLGNITPSTGSSEVSDAIYKLNTSYELTNEHTVYATWAQGFRRGGANALVSFDPPEFGTYDADTADNYEVGLKGTLADGAIQYTTAAFLIEWDNVQVSSFTPFGTGIVSNGKGAKNKGFELELSGRLTDELTFSTGYTYVDAKTDGEFTLPEQNAPNGSRLPGVPQHMASVALDYETPLSFWDNTTLGLHLGGSYRSKTRSAFENPNTFEIDGFSIWNLSATLERDNVRLSLFADNVFDELGITGGIGETIGPVGQYRYIARPRTIGLRLGFTFD